MKKDIVERTNALRTERGIASLTTNDKLMQAAQVRADEMAANSIYSHTRPDGQRIHHGHGLQIYRRKHSSHRRLGAAGQNGIRSCRVVVEPFSGASGQPS